MKRSLPACLVVLVVACAKAPSLEQAQPLAGVQSGGATDWYGPGITGLRRQGYDVRLAFLQPANVTILSLDDDGSLVMLSSESLATGVHTLRAPRQGTPETVLIQPASRQHAADAIAAARGEVEPTPPTGRIMDRPRTVSARVQSTAPVVYPGVTMQRFRERPDYLIVIASDVRLDLPEIERRMARVRDFVVDSIAHDLPEYLIGSRTAMWAGYVLRRP